MNFVRKNDIMPFFLHCDDVEYGLRCGKSPIILNGVQVWHRRLDENTARWIVYYDTRNPLHVNRRYAIDQEPDLIYQKWKDKISEFHLHRAYVEEYYIIRGMRDFLRGEKWLYEVNAEKLHKRLMAAKTSKYKNAIMWRMVSVLFWLKSRG